MVIECWIIENGDRMLNTEECPFEMVGMYVLLHVSIFFCICEMFLLYCTHIMCFCTQYLIHGLRELIVMPCCVVSVKCTFNNPGNFLRTNSLFNWRRLFFIVHSLWLLFSRIVWLQIPKNATNYMNQ